jgi:hypothetical protein
MVSALLKMFTGTSANSSLSNSPNKDQEASTRRQTTFCKEHGRVNSYHRSSKPSPGDSSEGPSPLLIVQQGTPLTLINTVQLVVRLKMMHIFSSIANGLVQFGFLRGCLAPKNFHPKTSHRILRHMHEALNVDETKN